MWWKKDKQNLNYAEYKVDNTLILVGNRPDFKGTTYNFFKNIDGWINVTDRYVNYPKEASIRWFPWNESGYPSVETIFAFIKTLHYWVNSNEYSKIYIHCDAGTHRAVTLFGLYLKTFHNNNLNNILENHKLTGRKHWSNPDHYSNSYIKDIPLLKELLPLIKESKDLDTHGEELANILNKISKKNIKEYNYERFIQKDIPYILYTIKLNLKLFLIYKLIKNPSLKLYRGIHKLFNTKKGKAYKKYKL